MEEFATVINKRHKAGARKFKVVYLPMPPGQLLAALNDGIGDIACTGIIITPERSRTCRLHRPHRRTTSNWSWSPPRPLLPSTVLTT